MCNYYLQKASLVLSFNTFMLKVEEMFKHYKVKIRKINRLEVFKKYHIDVDILIPPGS